MNLQLFQVLFCHKKYKYHFLINCKPFDFQGFKQLFNFQIFAVICTFSFGSAFAALQYEGTTTEVKPVAEVNDFYGYATNPTDKYNGTFGISTIQQKSEVAGLEYSKLVLSTSYPADLQAKVDAAYDAAIAAVKAAKTNKEMMLAEENFADTMVLLSLSGKDRTSLLAKYDAVTATDYVAEDGYYMIPDYGTIYVTGNKVDSKNDVLGNWLMDQGYYGYTTNSALVTALGSKTVKNAVATLLDDTYIGKVTLADVYDPSNTSVQAKQLEAYGRQVYAEYADAVGSFEEYIDSSKKTTTIDEFVAVMDKLYAFNAKYGFDGTCAIDPTDNCLSNSTADYAISLDNKLLVAIDNWYVTNLSATYDKLSKINKDADYTAAKADIIAAAKTILDTIDKYDTASSNIAAGLVQDYFGLANEMTGYVYQTVATALGKLMAEDCETLYKVFTLDTFTENVPVTATKTATFDSSEANLKALTAARTAFDAYVNDYEFAYAGVQTEESLASGVWKLSLLRDAELRLLAAEYNKANIAAVAEKADELDNAKYVALLNNATVKVTTVKEGKKVTVNAKVDAASMSALLGLNSDVTTVEYKFYHKAPGKAYKLTKTKTVNHITYSKSLKKGKNSFRVGVVLKDAKGNVLATKSYQASSLGYRTIK